MTLKSWTYPEKRLLTNQILLREATEVSNTSNYEEHDERERGWMMKIALSEMVLKAQERDSWLTSHHGEG
jgi:hypothetical protein